MPDKSTFLDRLAAAAKVPWGPMAWVWFTVLAALMIVGGELWLSGIRSGVETSYGAELSTLKQARLDLMKGYQHLAFAGQPGSPYDRLQGMTLLHQAIEELDSARNYHPRSGLAAGSASLAEARARFADSTARMRELLDSLPAGSEVDPATSVRIRSLLYGLEAQAAAVDAQIRQDRMATIDRIRGIHSAGLWAAALLLTVVCAAAYAGGRARQLAEAGLRRNEADLAITLQSIGDGVIATDIDGRITRMNPTAETLTGWRQDEALGRPLDAVFRIVHTMTREPVASPVALVLRKGEVVGLSNHTTLLARSGSEFQIADSAAPIREASGRVVGVVLVFHDVTAQYAMQQALHESEALHRLLAENISDVIWVLNLDTGRFRYVSPSVERLLGFTPEEVLARPAAEAMTPESFARIQQVIPERLQCAREGAAEYYTDEVCQPHKDGHIVPTEVVSHFRRNDDSGAWEVFGVTRDITARKKAEEAQAVLAMQLRQAQKLEAIGQLAGGVAHDFNNMLAALMLQLNLLEMRRNLDPEVRTIAKELTVEAKRAANLTRQLLMFSRKSVLQRQRLDLNESIDEMIKMLRRLIGENIDLTFLSQSRLPLVEADPGMLQQIVMNLTVNARDAMPDGGRITIATRLVEIGAEEARAMHERRPGRFVCLSVSDNGCGMDEATMKRLFEPFFTTKEMGRGTGLGLSTVHGIVAQHQGWVEVRSAPGRGAEFSVYLPAIADAPRVVALAEPAEESLAGTETILFVEDELVVRKITQRSLEGLGYRVLAARNAAEAEQLWREHGKSIDLLLTDMMLPEGLNGLDLSRRLRTERPGLHVIIASGYSAELVSRNPAVLQDCRYLPKPFSLAELTSAIRECCDGG